MALIPLTDKQFDDLLRITNVYRLQAFRCRKSKAYLAGCIMFGAALETALLTTTSLYSDEATKSKKLPTKKNGEPKPLLRWTLFELLAVAKDLEWLPATLSLDEEFDAQKARIGDYAEIVRQVRNLVHPAEYLDVYPNFVLRRKQFDHIYDILAAAVDWLLNKIYESLKETMEEEKATRRQRKQRHPIPDPH